MKRKELTCATIGYGFNFVELFLHVHKVKDGEMNEAARGDALGRLYVDTKKTTTKGG